MIKPVDVMSARSQPSLNILECRSSASKLAIFFVHRCAFIVESQEQTPPSGIEGFSLGRLHQKCMHLKPYVISYRGGKHYEKKEEEVLPRQV